MPENLLPDLLRICPEKSTPQNPAFIQIKEEHERWLDAFSALSQQEKDAAKKADMPLFAARLFPQVDAAALRGVVNYLMATIILDKINDDESPRGAKVHADFFMDALSAAGGERSSATVPKFQKLMRTLVSPIMDAVGSTHRAAFISANKYFSDGTIKEAEERLTAKRELAKPTIESYLDTRRRSVCVRPYLVFVWAKANPGLSKPLDDVSVATMEEAAEELVIMANDLYSYKKEYEDNDVQHNFLTVLMELPTSPAADLQGAINEAATLFESSLERFNNARSAIAARGSDIAPALERYAQGIVDLFVGNIEWSLVIPRYRVFDNEADREKRIMRT